MSKDQVWNIIFSFLTNKAKYFFQTCRGWKMTNIFPFFPDSVGTLIITQCRHASDMFKRAHLSRFHFLVVAEPLPRELVGRLEAVHRLGVQCEPWLSFAAYLRRLVRFVLVELGHIRIKAGADHGQNNLTRKGQRWQSVGTTYEESAAIVASFEVHRAAHSLVIFQVYAEVIWSLTVKLLGILWDYS